MDYKENFIKKSIEKYGDVYDYSEFKYCGNKVKGEIYCKKHDITFYQTPDAHLHFYGCKKCSSEYKSLARSKKNSQFIVDAKKVHGDKYDYSKVEYKNANTEICIICPEHGEFWQTPHTHLNGCGCPKCGIENSKLKRNYNTKVFIEKAREVHGNKYDYSKVEYVNAKTPVCIICPEHGEFWQKPSKHLQGQGCRKCYEEIRGEKLKISFEEFLAKANAVHNGVYSYNKETYSSTQKKIEIICKKHGRFIQTVNSHLRGCGCPKCALELKSEKQRLSTEEFIHRSKNVHGDRFIYDESEYVSWNTPIKIICPEHGEFWQKPSKHLQGQGCPHCKISVAESFVENKLLENKIKYIYRAKKHDGLLWIGKQELDFFMPEYSIAIEVQGIQHYEPRQIKGISIEDAISNYHKQIKLDAQKLELCKKNNVNLLYFTQYKEKSDNISTYSDINQLFEKIIYLIKLKNCTK